MTADMPTVAEMRAALATFNLALDAGSRNFATSAQVLAGIVERVATAHEELAERLDRPQESYTPAGMPRLAAARARAAGARITQTCGGGVFRVDFPNGSRILAITRPAARRLPQREAATGRVIDRRRGAAPGALPPEGQTLEAVLNNFADEQDAQGQRERA